MQHASSRIELLRSINAFYDCMADIEYRHYLPAFLFIINTYFYLPKYIVAKSRDSIEEGK